MNGPNVYLPKQCAAVTIHLALSNAPPQKGLLFFLSHNKTCQGIDPTAARLPPIIFPVLVNFALPQAKKWRIQIGSTLLPRRRNNLDVKKSTLFQAWKKRLNHVVQRQYDVDKFTSKNQP